MSYKDLMRLFSRANQGHTLRLSHLTGDPVVNVSSCFDRIERGGKVVGLLVDCIEGRAADGGTLHSLDVGVVRGFLRELPLHVHINDSISIDAVVDGEVGAILISALECLACPLRLNASISIGRFTSSRFLGVSVGATTSQVRTRE
jgi:hypothetical protein